ncbi:IS3 family transposase [Paenibacillus sp. SN-8-1]
MYGYRKITVLLRKEQCINHKRVADYAA